MLKRYYLDTSILLDFFEKRGENGEKALKLIGKIMENGDIIIISDLHINELKHLGYNYNEIIGMLGVVRKNLRKIHIYKEEKEINEAEEAVLEAAESADEEEKEFLTRAERDLEKAEAEVIESQGE